jgi:hypothetical protein
MHPTRIILFREAYLWMARVVAGGKSREVYLGTSCLITAMTRCDALYPGWEHVTEVRD